MVSILTRVQAMYLLTFLPCCLNTPTVWINQHIHKTTQQWWINSREGYSKEQAEWALLISFQALHCWDRTSEGKAQEELDLLHLGASYRGMNTELSYPHMQKYYKNCWEPKATRATEQKS